MNQWNNTAENPVLRELCKSVQRFSLSHLLSRSNPKVTLEISWLYEKSRNYMERWRTSSSLRHVWSQYIYIYHLRKPSLNIHESPVEYQWSVLICWHQHGALGATSTTSREWRQWKTNHPSRFPKWWSNPWENEQSRQIQNCHKVKKKFSWVGSNHGSNDTQKSVKVVISPMWETKFQCSCWCPNVKPWPWLHDAEMAPGISMNSTLRWMEPGGCTMNCCNVHVCN